MDNRGIFEAVMGDGRPLLALVGVALVLSGGFALFLSATGQFLPHDVAYLGMSAVDLCSFFDCRIVEFMIHDRAAFGGGLIAIGSLFLWLVEFPLKEQEAWAWWTLLLSGAAGFTSFLAYLGYGYLDTWHGVATLLLLPIFGAGLYMTYGTLDEPRSARTLARASDWGAWRSAAGAGRLILLLTALGMMAGGLTVMIVGITQVFVPQDLAFMHAAVADLDAISPRLVPLIAHDRAGFGGAVFSTGIAAFLCIWRGQPTKSLWQIMLVAGGVGFGCAIGIHFLVGYIDFVHLAPAFLAVVLLAVGLALTYGRMAIRPAAEADRISGALPFQRNQRRE